MIEESRGLPWQRVPLPLFNGLALQAIRGKRGGMGRGGGADKMVVRELELSIGFVHTKPYGGQAEGNQASQCIVDIRNQSRRLLARLDLAQGPIYSLNYSMVFCNSYTWMLPANPNASN